MDINRLLAAAGLSLLVVACQQQEPATRSEDMRTIENVKAGSLPVETPPSLEEQVPVSTTSTTGTSEADRKTAAKAKEEALARRMDLPFAPAIAMDPVDGAKVSITTATPTTEYKNKIYYFSSDGNRRTFLASPETYLKGQLAKY